MWSRTPPSYSRKEVGERGVSSTPRELDASISLEKLSSPVGTNAEDVSIPDGSGMSDV